MGQDYQALLDTKSPGEVIVHTGDATAADARKVRWEPTGAQRDLARAAVAADMELVRARGGAGEYAERMQRLVEGGLREAGVDPATLRLLAA